MQVAADRIAAPDQDQLRFGEELDPHAELAAQRVAEGLAAGRRADRTVEQRCAELVEEAPVHRFALHQSHRAGVAVRQHGLRAMRIDHRTQACGDVVKRDVPGHRLELRATRSALHTDAPHRLQYPLGMRAALQIAGNLGAQHAAGVRMRRIALQLDRDAVLNGRDQRTGVGAIVRTGAEDGGGSGRKRLDSHRHSLSSRTNPRSVLTSAESSRP